MVGLDVARPGRSQNPHRVDVDLTGHGMRPGLLAATRCDRQGIALM
jgi:hypothetical protein